MVRVTLSCCLILLFTNCSDMSGPRGRRPEQGTLNRGEIAFPVEVMPAKEREAVEWIRAIGSVSADKSVNLAAEVGGTVAGIYVDVGDTVEKGTLLARLDEERLRIARDLARAEVEIAKANLADSRGDARRQADLFREGVISEDAVEEAELRVNVHTGQLDMAAAKLAAAERDLSDAAIVSPIDGEITRKYIEVGELIQPGEPLFDIVDLARVKVVVHVSELDVTKIKKAQDAEIKVDGYPGIGFHGEVHTIAAQAEPQTRTFPVEILVVNDKPQRLLPGFIGRVRIRGRTFPDAIVLPQDVVVERDGRPTVFIVTSETVAAKAVELGFEDRGNVLITRGIEPGDTVVVTGQKSLRDGMKVDVR